MMVTMYRATLFPQVYCVWKSVAFGPVAANTYGLAKLMVNNEVFTLLSYTHLSGIYLPSIPKNLFVYQP